MRFLDDQGRLFGKINIIDLIVLLGVAAGVLFIAVRANREPEPVIEYHQAEYVFEISGVRENAAKAYQVGDTVYDGTVAVGTIREVEYAKQKVAQLQPDGSYQEVERKLFYKVRLLVETDQYYEDEGRYINGKKMLLGTTHTITNGLTNHEATLTDLKLIDHK